MDIEYQQAPRTPPYAPTDIAQDLRYSTHSDSSNSELQPAYFWESKCAAYCCGCFFSIILGLVISLGILIIAPGLGLLLAALTPGLIFMSRLYQFTFCARNRYSFFSLSLLSAPNYDRSNDWLYNSILLCIGDTL